MKRLDIVVPCYNEQECIRLFYDAVSRVMRELKGCDWTVCYVDDGSSDDTLSEIKKLAAEKGERQIKYVSFTRNFGKEAAIYAGLKHSDGDLVALMDADLQDPPTLLPEMLKAVNEEGYDSCATCRTSRTGEPPVRSFFANVFYRLINSISDTKFKPGARDFRLMTHEMRDAVLKLGETERFTKGLLSWVGFRTKWIEYENVKRAAGQSKWSFFKLLKYAISGIVAFSTAPLRLASVLGFVVVGAAALYALYIFLKAVIYGTNSSGFSTIIILMMFFSGIIILLLGIIGEYLSRVYSEIKRRPVYIARETNAAKDREEER
ncbi:MAG: glycosyltransferase family 2 protein [Clostridiales Family XIII bacterium]|jgi:glycosyltransferase involved in cell wall biosynthesis|nr:glycosyltransferase family 2 protein [Clostridiales Family XIII bacterium]